MRLFDSFGELLAVLIVLVPVIGKLIEKSLKAAGKPDMQRKMHDVLEPFYDEDKEKEDLTEEDEAGKEYVPETVLVRESPAPVPIPVPVAQMPAVQPAAELLEGGYRSIKDIVRDRQQAEKSQADDKAGAGKLDIDPKKLVIYSEIMNPKY